MTSRPPFFIPLVLPRALPRHFIAVLAAAAIGAGRVALEGGVRLVAGHLAIPPIAVDAMSIVGLVAVFVVLVPLVQASATAAMLEAFGRFAVDARLATLITACLWAAGQGWIGGFGEVASTMWTFWIVCMVYQHLRASQVPALSAAYAASALATGNALALAFILGA